MSTSRSQKVWVFNEEMLNEALNAWKQRFITDAGQLTTNEAALNQVKEMAQSAVIGMAGFLHSPEAHASKLYQETPAAGSPNR
jgi:hypothetical protein